MKHAQIDELLRNHRKTSNASHWVWALFSVIIAIFVRSNRLNLHFIMGDFNVYVERLLLAIAGICVVGALSTLIQFNSLFGATSSRRR